MTIKTCKFGCNSICAERNGKLQDVCPICWNKIQAEKTKEKQKQL